MEEEEEEEEWSRTRGEEVEQKGEMRGDRGKRMSGRQGRRTILEKVSSSCK